MNDSLKRLVVVTAGVLFFVNCCNINVYAQKENANMPFYKDIEYTGNMLSGSTTPTAISFAPIDRYIDISARYGLDRGDFHAIDKSASQNQLGIDIHGLQQIGKVTCFGKIKYLNGKEKDRCWNSTLFVSEDNPFILGDSIRSDFRTEHFELQGVASYRMTNRLTLGLNLRYLVGSSADQSDPRSKADGMRFYINPGISWQVTDKSLLGISGKIAFFKESITHAVVNPQVSYIYFRFNGMGDFSSMSSGKMLSYPRDYDGKEYQGALQYVWKGKTLANFVELYYAGDNEDARDGGTSFTYLGGDYSRKIYGFTERFTIRTNRLIHNITLDGAIKNIEGIWYDQTEFIDPDKNNQLSYKIQDSSLKNKEDVISASATYRMDIMRKGVPTFNWYAKGLFENSQMKHYEDDGYSQKYTNITAEIGAKKYFTIKKSLLTLSLQGKYVTPLSASMTPMRRLNDVYTTPQFEYKTASRIAGTIGVEVNIPVAFRNFNTWLGFSANAKTVLYTGDSKFTDRYDGTHYNSFWFGAHLLF